MKNTKLVKKIAAVVITGALALTSLVGCGNSTNAASESQSAASASAESQDQAKEEKVIKIGATATPHGEILEEAKAKLAEQGITLEITIFDDYVLPMTAVESGELDANYFAHVPYVDQFNVEQGTHIVNVGGIHYEPFGIYPGTKKSLDEIADGDTIAVPNDTTNEARALLLLEANGLIKLKDDAGLTATVNDIVENPKNIKIEELEAAQVARVINEVAFVVLNGNYALAAGLSVGKDSIAFEASDSEAAKTYVNIVAVKEGNENNEAIKALVDVLKSDDITNFINEKYDGAVVPFK